MKIIKLASVVIVALLVTGIGYFALTDVPVDQQEVSKDIPHERFRD